MTRLIPIAAAAALLAGCATTSPDQREEIALAKALDGRVAGKPRTCLPLVDTNTSRTHAGVMLYGSGRTIYRQDFGGNCPGLRWSVIPVFQVRGTEICQGDIVQLADRGAGGGFAGSCVVGPFVPFTRP